MMKDTRPAMRRFSLFLALFFILTDAIGADNSAHRFTLSYSADASVCREFARLVASERTAFFADDPFPYTTTTGASCPANERVMPLEEIASGEYGYTQVYRSQTCFDEDYAVVYVSKFQGDRAPRLEQTWKVDASDLRKVLTLPPGPRPYAKWGDVKSWLPIETNAPEFAALLAHSEKITDQWSPVVLLDGKNYAVERECSGQWAYGGVYQCNKVIKFTVRRLAVDEPSIPVCRLTKNGK
jgi:hypothetical protein